MKEALKLLKGKRLRPVSGQSIWHWSMTFVCALIRVHINLLRNKRAERKVDFPELNAFCVHPLAD